MRHSRTRGRFSSPFAAQLILAVMVSGSLGFLAPETRSSLQSSAVQDCPQAIIALLSHPAFPEFLLNPSDLLVETRSLVSQAGECLRQSTVELPVAGQPPTQQPMSRQSLLNLVDLFEIYTQPPDSAIAFAIDPATSTDPALVWLRDQVGAPPPAGFFHVLLYPSRLAMPEPLAGTFADANIYGATYFTRYVALVLVDSLHYQNTGQLDRETQTILSHELVHAYVNASFGFPAFEAQPRWYSEGLAIYFSGGDQRFVYRSPSSTFERGLSAEYRSYDRAFILLKERLGKEGLDQAIRQSIVQADPTILLEAAGFTSSEDLMAAVAKAEYQLQQRARLVAFLCVGLPILIVIVMAVAAKLMPERLTCPECGRATRRDKLVDQRCPYCGAPITYQPSKDSLCPR